MVQSVISAPKRKRYKVNLPEQLADCEVNYQYLLSLLPDVTSQNEGEQFCYVVGGATGCESSIRLKLIEQTKYTSLVHIVHYCQLQETSRNNRVDLTYSGDVRLYHDADMAEVVKCQRYRQFAPRYEYPNVNMHQVNEKAQMNRFLRDLLAYCLATGRIDGPVIDF